MGPTPHQWNQNLWSGASTYIKGRKKFILKIYEPFNSSFFPQFSKFGTIYHCLSRDLAKVLFVSVAAGVANESLVISNAELIYSVCFIYLLVGLFEALAFQNQCNC